MGANVGHSLAENLGSGLKLHSFFSYHVDVHVSLAPLTECSVSHV